MPLSAQPLAGKTAVVTGASRGIGEAIARRLASAGATVALLARDPKLLDAIAAEITASGGRAAAVVVDVAVADSVSAAADEVHRTVGPIDVLVNNAGAVLREAFAETTEAQWREIIAVNLDGTYRVTRAFAGDLIARAGRIINIASISGRQGTAMLSAYCASKHGVVGLTRALAEELRPHEVAVNAICPGSVDTEMLQRGIPGAEPKMTPADIATCALFLAAEAPLALTGSCLDVFG